MKEERKSEMNSLRKRLEDLKIELKVREQKRLELEERRKAAITKLKEMGWDGEVERLAEEIDSRLKALSEAINELEGQVKGA